MVEPAPVVYGEFIARRIPLLISELGFGWWPHRHEDAGHIQLHVCRWAAPWRQESIPEAVYIQLAYTYVRDVVESALEGFGACQLQPKGVGKFSLVFELPNLLRAIWVQFALAIAGDKDYQQCPACQTWFELSPGLNRADRQFCSNVCRTRAYRRRIAKAKHLYKKGAR